MNTLKLSSIEKILKCIYREYLYGMIYIKKKIEDKEEIFLDEKVLCIRLEPKLEAKSYVPDSLMISEDMQIIGGRKYAFVDENGEKKDAKLYFVKAKNAGIDKLEKTLRNGSKDTVEKWRRQIQSIKNIDLLSSEEKVQGLTEDWTVRSWSSERALPVLPLPDWSLTYP